jgi:hypothetical protein
MSDQLIFDPIASMTILIVVLSLALTFFVWLEWARLTAHRTIRITAAVIAIIGLFGLFARPSFSTKTNGEVILVTKNYDGKKLDSLKQANPYASLVAIDSTAKEIKQLSSINELGNYAEVVRYILGDGLSPAELEFFKNKSFEYYPANIPEGIIALNLPRGVFAKQGATISGTINAPKIGKLILATAGEKIDSFEIRKEGVQPFAISFIPKQPGKFLYTIEHNQEIDTLPIVVNQSKKLKILLLQESPTFESKYLKNFLSEQHQLVVRYQLSKNKHRYEFANLPDEKVDKLTLQSLSRFDLLIVDSDFLNGLSSNEEKAIDTSIKNGLGLIVLASDKNVSSDKIARISGMKFSNYKSDTAKFALTGGSFTLPAVNLNLIGVSVQVIKNQTRTLAGVKSKGLGKIGIQLLQETYQLQLQSDSLVYAKLWTQLIQQTSRIEMKSNSVAITNACPIYSNDPIHFDIISGDQHPRVFLDSIRIPLNEDFYFDDLYHSKNWASKIGWHNVSIEGDSTPTYFYVSSSQSLKSLRTANQIHNTLRKAGTGSTKETHAKTVYSKISPLIFLILFFAGVATLWLVPKL